METIRLQRDHLLRDLELAAEVQRRLLPQEVPQLAKLEVAASMRPAKTVGGDYYDFFEQGDGRLGSSSAISLAKACPQRC